MNEKFWLRVLNSPSGNLKPVLSQAEGSKRCPEQSRSIENPKWLGLSVIAFVLVMVGAGAEAQQPKKVPRIGYLSSLDSASDFRSEPFGQALRELGYIEGQNITVEYR